MPIDRADSKKISPVEVGLGIVLRPIPYTNRTSSKNITRTQTGQTGGYEILITKRPTHTVYGGYWELPGGKCEDGENPADCVRRELREELGIEIDLVTPLNRREHVYDHGAVRLHPWVCRLASDSGEPQALEVDEFRWVSLDQVAHDRFPEANEAVIEELRARIQAREIPGACGQGPDAGV